jgi:serine protease Do
MKHPIVTRLFPVLLLATTAFAEGEPKKDVIIRRREVEGGPHFNVRVDRDERGPIEKEKVAYLGVETSPVSRTVATQLGLVRDTGLVVRRVADGSPAASLLQEHDILTKLDDQILIDMHQLSVLVRSHKNGDEVKLTVMRGGKESVVKAKLAEHEVPKMPGDGFGMFLGANGPGGGNMMFRRMPPGGPGEEGPEAADVMRLIRGERGHWFARPRVHVFKRGGGKGSTVLDLPSGNFVFSDDAGSVEVNAVEGKRELTVKDKQGTVTFQGPITTPEDHAKLPPEVMARLDAIGGAELGDDEELEFETKVLDPATKTRHILPAPRSPDEPGMRSL